MSISSTVLDSFKEHSIVLLLGDTGNGKTYTTFKMIEHDIANDCFWILVTHDAINVKSYLPGQTPLTQELGDLEFDPGIAIPQVVLTENLSSGTNASEFVKFIIWITNRLEPGKFTLYIDDAPNEVTIELMDILQKYGTLDELNIKLLVTDYGDLLKFLIESKQSVSAILLGSRQHEKY